MGTRKSVYGGTKSDFLQRSDVRGHLIPFATPKELFPVTPVELVYDSTMWAKGIPYIFAWVKDPADPEETIGGFLPRYGVFAGYVTGLSKEDTSGEEFTGVKYGAYKVSEHASSAETLEDFSSVSIPGKKKGTYNYLELMSAKDATCPYCGGDRGDHKILETKAARDLAVQCWQVLRQPPVQTGRQPGPPTGGEVMIGVLIRNKERYLALSQGASTTQTQLARAYCNNNNIRSVETANLEEPLKDVNGGDIDVAKLKLSYDAALICAGPKLLQYVNQRSKGKSNEIYLSEVWYSSTDTHGKYKSQGTIDSCDRCRIVVPRMLCGYKNKYSKKRLAKTKLARPTGWKSIEEMTKK